MYLSSGLFKLQVGGGLGWLNGYTLSYYMTLDGFGGGGNGAILMAQSIPLMIASSIVAVGFELTFALGVLVPALTLPYMVVGLGFHAANWVLLDAAFPLVMAMYGVFIPALARGPAVAAVRAFLASRTRASVARGTVETSRGWSLVYDGLCPLCVRTTILLSSLELRSRLRFVDFEAEWDRAAELVPGLTPADARHAWALVGPRGQVYRGFFAFRALTRILPPLWAVAPLAHMPGSGLVGPRVYSWVAARRARRSCDSGSCAPTPAVR
jgi:predicted DCC family thiol-disulfide oxidoreductase YuxK